MREALGTRHQALGGDHRIGSAITLAVLAGGAGSRMGGVKDRVRIGGKAILDDLMDRVTWEGPTVLVVAPGRPGVEGAGRFDVVVADAVGGEGPLRGVMTALGACATEWMVVMAMDMPGVGREQLKWLIERSPGAGCVMMKRVEGGVERVEPLPVVLRREMAGVVGRMLEGGERAVHALTGIPGARLVAAPAGWPSAVWTNLNRPEDVRAFVG